MKIEASHYFAAATERMKQARMLYMDQLENKLRQILEAAFPERQELTLNDDDGIIGILVSREFEGVEAIDRQDRIWDVLDRSLTPEERRRVQIIVAATPDEHAGHTAAL